MINIHLKMVKPRMWKNQLIQLDNSTQLSRQASTCMWESNRPRHMKEFISIIIFQVNSQDALVMVISQFSPNANSNIHASMLKREAVTDDPGKSPSNVEFSCWLVNICIVCC